MVNKQIILLSEARLRNKKPGVTQLNCEAVLVPKDLPEEQ